MPGDWFVVAQPILGLRSFPDTRYLWKSLQREGRVQKAWKALQQVYPFLVDAHRLAVE